MEFRPFFVLPPAFFVAEREASANNRGAARVTAKNVHMTSRSTVGAEGPELDGAQLLRAP